MNNNIDEILKDVLLNDRVASKIDEAKLTKEQMIEGLAIFIEMANEVEDGKREYLTTFYVNDAGQVKRTFELAKNGMKLDYLNNIISQDIDNVDYEGLEEFIKEEGRKEAVNSFSSHLKMSDEYIKGMYIYGQMGIGKSYLLKLFVKKLAQEGKKVAYVNLPNLILKVKQTFGEIGDQTTTLIKRLQNVEYLFIDDIGSEKITSWFRDDFLFIILNERMDRKRTTFFSSNFSQSDLAKKEAKTSNAKYQDFDNANRLVSRVRGLSKEINLKGTNKRY